MGYTSQTISRVTSIIAHNAIRRVIDLGAQNNYSLSIPEGGSAPYMSEWYQSQDIDYAAIDLSAENNSLPIDLALPVDDELGQFDLLVDAGTSEHIGIGGKYFDTAIYNCWKTKHNLVKPGGYIISENPKTGNWPGHGFNYYTTEFYTRLATLCHYDIIELGEHPAMGNTTDGWNIHCILRKKEDTPFISSKDFATCGIKQS